MSTSDESFSHDEDEVFNTFLEMAREGNDTERQAKIEKYMKTGFTEEEAMDKADDKLRTDDWKVFMNLIGYIMKLQDGKIHTKIMETIRLYMKAGYDDTTSVRMALKKYRHQLEEYLEHDDYPDSIAKATSMMTMKLMTAVKKKMKRKKTINHLNNICILLQVIAVTTVFV